MKKGYWYVISLLIAGLDQLTKQLALQYLTPYKPLVINSVFNLYLSFNTGAAFSFMSGTSLLHRWFFSIFSIIMSLVIVIWLSYTDKRQRLQLASLSMILGGAVGNLYDRVSHGVVIDFIDLHYKSYHWAIFNVADMAISIGAILLMIELIFFHKKS